MAFGCADLTSDEEAHSVGAPAAEEGRLRLSLYEDDGTNVPHRVFDEKDRVHLGVWLAEGSTRFADGDLAFVVVDAHGAQVSTDALDCRRFRVGFGRALIVEVLAGRDAGGAPCQHAWGHHDTGRLLPQLAPFADVSPDAQGLMSYEVRVARVEAIVDGEFPAHALRLDFFVRATGAPACGNGHVDDGEGCDDGNTTDGDGCSATCTVEDKDEECCEGGACCGNGRVNEGEDCDDGNRTSGDGCSASCKVEVIH